MAFNTKTRTNNSIKISLIGGITNIFKILLGFGYRTVFLFVLSDIYLGINGLFTNILQILSLAELGVTTAIVYRFYEPISKNDVAYVGKLMNFFSKIYRIIAITILSLGLVLLPFINILINESDSVPEDVNIYVVFLLFLLNTVSSYVFSYKLMLLTADQKNYVFSVIDLIITIVKYTVQISILFITHNYTLTLLFGIISTLLVNYVASTWTQKQYKEVFEVKEMLSKEDQKKILLDTKACMYHKVGTTVLNGTDNIVLTKMVSLSATGIYSNYSMLITYLQQFVVQLIGNFTASIGNADNTMPKERYYDLYKKLNFSNLWISSTVSVGVFTVINDFITVWLGKEFLLHSTTVLVICIQLFISLNRTITGSFIGASGLFVKDKIRPLIESVINLVISIIFSRYWGIVGVFLGTIISSMLTSFWREPYLLYKYSFNQKVSSYWRVYFAFSGITIMSIIAVIYIKQVIIINSIIGVILEGVVVELLINIILLLFFMKCNEFQFIKSMVSNLYIKVKNFRKSKN